MASNWKYESVYIDGGKPQSWKIHIFCIQSDLAVGMNYAVEHYLMGKLQINIPRVHLCHYLEKKEKKEGKSEDAMDLK